MKNKFLFLLILGLAFFASCSDDDNDGPKDFNGVYSTGSTDFELDLKYSDAVFTGKSVEFNSTDGQKATLKLQGVIPGEKETVISDIELIPSNSVYTFTAENKNDSRTVNLNGSIEKGKLTLGVNVKFVNHELMKTWELATKPVLVVWEPKELPLGNFISNFGETPFTVGFLSTVIAPSVGGMLHDYLKDVTFEEDGNIIATYNSAVATDENPDPEVVWASSALNLAHYCMKDGVCYVYPNVEMIMRQVEIDQAGRSEASDPMTQLLTQLLNDGIPVHFDKEGLSVYLDQDFLKQLTPLIPLVGALVDENTKIEVKDFPIGIGSITVDVTIPIKPIIDNLPNALTEAIKIKIGLNLKNGTSSEE